jgi:molecular chaperone DnaJ
MNILMECRSCRGKGLRITMPCKSCKAKGHANLTVKETLIVPKGVDENVQLRIQGKGHYSPFGNNGDLFVNLKIMTHSYFKREDYDIHTTNYITVAQAVLGGKVKVRTLYGETDIDVDAGTNDGDVRKILNHGIVNRANKKVNGNHYVKFRIVVPKRMSDEQKSLYEELSLHEEEIIQNFD